MFEDHISREEVLERIKKHWFPEPLSKEIIYVKDAFGRKIAEDQFSIYDFPVYRASAMDGIAVNYDILADGMPDTSNWSEGREYVMADTGDDFDDRYDTVIPVEWIDLDECGHISITVKGELIRGSYVTGAGSWLRKGETLVCRGTRLSAFHLARLTAGGILQIPVVRRPKVAFIPTGSELINPGTEPCRGTNIDSNSIMAENEIISAGADPVMYDIVHDKKSKLEEVFEDAVSKADIVIINGGSSKGKEDFNSSILNEKGKQLFHWVRSGPGRPMSAAIVGSKIVVNLAGPSLAALSGLKWLLPKLVDHMTGESRLFSLCRTAILDSDINNPPLDFFFLVRVYEKDGKLYASAIQRGSEFSYSANAYFMTDYRKRIYNKGEEISVSML